MDTEEENLTTKIARQLWYLSVQHSDSKNYGEYRIILDQINSKDQEFAVTCIMKISLLIDAYTYQATNKPTSE